jgi:hypothetical protein
MSPGGALIGEWLAGSMSAGKRVAPWGLLPNWFTKSSSRWPHNPGRELTALNGKKV